MRVLLDTHALLWLIADDKRLSQPARQAFLDPANDLFFSVASFWEICIKISLEKLKLAPGWPDTIQREMTQNTVGWLPIETGHCLAASRLPFHHRDPFDRMLVAQAQVEALAVMSADHGFSDYPVQRIW